MQTKNSDLKNQLTHYFRDIKRLLLCKRKLKIKILNDLRNNIDDYIESNPNVMIDMIIKHFGTPRTIAEEFAAQSGIDYIKKARTKKALKITIIVFLIALTISIVSIATVIIKNNRQNAVYYYDETISDNDIIQ